MFAEDYPRFIEVSELTPDSEPGPQQRSKKGRRGRTAEEQANRMNERYEAFFGSNQDIFAGARVLDLASHDGRYSFAALKAGAAHVTGVEVRQSLIDRAQDTFAFYGQDPDTYRFVQGDLFEVLAQEKFEVDVVLCLGFMYHTYRHTEMMYRLHALNAKHLILDTMVVPATQPILRMILEEDVQDIRSAAQDEWAVGRVSVLWPSVPVLQLLMKGYDFEIESRYDWQGRLAGQPPIFGLEGYQNGRRVTLRCRSKAYAAAAGLPPVAPLVLDPVAPEPDAAKATPGPDDEPSGGWRERVNKTLAKATGYELRRASDKG